MYTITFDNQNFFKPFDDLANFMQDLSPVMQEIGEALIQSTRERMVAGETPDGTPFAPRSQTTLDIYARLLDPFSQTPLGDPGICGPDRCIRVSDRTFLSSAPVRCNLP